MAKEYRRGSGSYNLQENGRDVVLSGYASVFNQLAPIDDYWEQIKPGAFSDVLLDDTRFLWNHNQDYVLGRTKNESLTMGEDSHGLRFSCILPNTSFARDLAVLINRRDVDQCSFGFNVGKDTWHTDDTKRRIRTVEKIKKLWDLSVVTWPAYSGTTCFIKDTEPKRDLSAAERNWIRIERAKLDMLYESITRDLDNELKDRRWVIAKRNLLMRLEHPDWSKEQFIQEEVKQLFAREWD